MLYLIILQSIFFNSNIFYAFYLTFCTIYTTFEKDARYIIKDVLKHNQRWLDSLIKIFFKFLGKVKVI